jgi:hypothetical protein
MDAVFGSSLESWERSAMSKPGASRPTARAAVTLTASLALGLASCGTLLYPERRGQPPGRLDPGVAVLDGVGLVLFFVPGVVAFIVDFATGAIYLPPEDIQLVPVAVTDLRPVRVDPAELTPRRVEGIVREQTGRAVTLAPGEYQAMKLGTLDDFTPEALSSLNASPQPAAVRFRTGDE